MPAIQLALAGVVLLILALIFAVPRRPAPAPSLEQPGQALVDRVGVVSPEWAWTMGGALQRDPRFQLAVLIDARPPAGPLAEWAIQQANAWRIGAEEDNGVVLFVFTRAGIARAEVGYALEYRLPDLLVRQVLAQRAAPRFAAGDWEGGIEAFRAAIAEALGGDEALHRLWRELALEPPPRGLASLLGVYLEGWERAPRTLAALWRTYLEGGPTERLAVLIAAAILLALAIVGIGALVETLGVAVRLLRPRPAAAGAPDGSHAADRTWLEHPAFDLAFKVAATAVVVLLLMFGLSLVGDHLHRKGEFSGAGAEVRWPAA